MLNTEGQRRTVASGLKEYLGCEVIRTNQTAEMPPFPYLGYNITTLARENKGTYGIWNDGKARKPVVQIYSFTAHSDDYSEAVELANQAHEWLDYAGTQYLNDANVIVQSVGSVTDRSNLLTSDYVYSYGFDCFFWLYDEVETTLATDGTIETATIGDVSSEKPEPEDELNKRLEKRLSGVL